MPVLDSFCKWTCSWTDAFFPFHQPVYPLDHHIVALFIRRHVSICSFIYWTVSLQMTHLNPCAALSVQFVNNLRGGGDGDSVTRPWQSGIWIWIWMTCFAVFQLQLQLFSQISVRPIFFTSWVFPSPASSQASLARRRCVRTFQIALALMIHWPDSFSYRHSNGLHHLQVYRAHPELIQFA